MKIEYWKIKDVKPYHQNPRKNESAVDGLSESIADFDFVQPIVVDEKGVIVIGHTRRLAAIKLNLDEVPVFVASHLTPEQCRKLRIIDNSTHDLSSWDFEKLLPELDAMPDVDFKVFGLDLEKLMLDAQGLIVDSEESSDEGRKQNDKITVLIDDMSRKAEVKAAISELLEDYKGAAHLK